MRYALTPSQYRVFQRIEALADEMHPIGPSNDDLRKTLNISKNALDITLKALRQRGWIDWIPATPRSLRILPATMEYFPSQYKPGRRIYHAKPDGTFTEV